MSDILETGLAWLRNKRHETMTQAVSLARGASSSLTLATLGRSQFDELDSGGTLRRTDARDFLFRTSDYDFGSGAVEPDPGDRIGHDGAIYEVISPPGEPAWRYCDSYRNTIRVHAKLIG